MLHETVQVSTIIPHKKLSLIIFYHKQCDIIPCDEQFLFFFRAADATQSFGMGKINKGKQPDQARSASKVVPPI